MKELLVTIGLILLGGFIVATLVLGDTGSLKSAATGVVGRGVTAIGNIQYPTGS